MARKRDIVKNISVTHGYGSPVLHGNHNIFNQTIVSAASSQAVSFRDELFDPVELYFQGFDTLALGRLFDVLMSHRVPTSDHTIYVHGRDNDSGHMVSMGLKCAAGVVNGYIRTITAEHIENGDRYEIGGSNATIERIAADKITVYLEKRVFDAIPTDYSYLLIYASSRKSQLNSDLGAFARRHQREAAVTSAKILSNRRSADLLLEYINSGFRSDVMELVCEAFRSLSLPCAADEALAVRVTMSLTNFVKRRIAEPEFAVSVIYAIESLGYVAPTHATTKAMFCSFINDLLHSDCNCRFHRQLVWASLVAVKRSHYSNLDLGLIDTFEKPSLDFEGPLPKLVHDITEQQLRLPYQPAKS